MFYCPALCSSFVLYCVVIVCSRTTVETSHKALLWFDPTWVSLLSCIFNNQINSLATFHSQLMLGAGPPSGSCTWTIKPLTATPCPVWRLSIYTYNTYNLQLWLCSFCFSNHRGLPLLSPGSAAHSQHTVRRSAGCPFSFHMQREGT